MSTSNDQREERLRAGVIGVGNMGRHHARIYSNHIDTTLIGVADADESRAIEIAEQYATRALETSDLLEAVDVASVAVPTPYHAETVRRCIDRGVDVLIEKPFVEDVAVGEELIELAADRDVTIQVGHVERFNPAFMALDGIVDDLDILAIDAERLGPPLDREFRANSIIDLMIHDIDLLGSLVDSEIVSIDAQGTTENKYATATFSFECGTIATLTASRVTQQKVRRLRLTAKSALVDVDYIDRTVEIHRQSVPEYVENNGDIRYRHESIVERPMVENGEPLRNEIDAFVSTVRNGTPPVVTAEDGLRAMELAQRIDHLASTGERE